MGTLSLGASTSDLGRETLNGAHVRVRLGLFVLGYLGSVMDGMVMSDGVIWVNLGHRVI